MSDVFVWTLSQERTSVRRLTRTYWQQFSTDTGCSLEDQPEAMDDRDEWWERLWKICVNRKIWWWYGWCSCIGLFSVKKKDHVFHWWTALVSKNQQLEQNLLLTSEVIQPRIIPNLPDQAFHYKQCKLKPH